MNSSTAPFSLAMIRAAILQQRREQFLRALDGKYAAGVKETTNAVAAAARHSGRTFRARGRPSTAVDIPASAVFQSIDQEVFGRTIMRATRLVIKGCFHEQLVFSKLSIQRSRLSLTTPLPRRCLAFPATPPRSQHARSLHRHPRRIVTRSAVAAGPAARSRRRQNPRLPPRRPPLPHGGPSPGPSAPGCGFAANVPSVTLIASQARSPSPAPDARAPRAPRRAGDAAPPSEASAPPGFER